VGKGTLTINNSGTITGGDGGKGGTGGATGAGGTGGKGGIGGTGDNGGISGVGGSGGDGGPGGAGGTLDGKSGLGGDPGALGLSTTGIGASGTLGDVGAAGKSGAPAGGVGKSGNGGAGIEQTGGILNLTNTGTIRGGSGAVAGHGIELKTDGSNPALTATITNLGTISSGGAGGFGISVTGGAVVTSLTNAQGGLGADPLTYDGNLPTTYTTVLRGQDSYGQLDVSNAATSTTTVNATSAIGSSLPTQRFNNVVSGVPIAQVTNLGPTTALQIANGVIGMVNPNATDSNAVDIRTLNFGQDLAQPQRALLAQRSNAVRFGLDYNCDTYNEKGFGVAIQARQFNSGGSDENTVAFIVAKRLTKNLSIGLFTEAGRRTEDSLKLEVGSRQPLAGAFANYSAKADGTGLQARLSAGMERSSLNVTRSNLFGTSESVSGRADVDVSGASLRVGYGVSLKGSHVVTPFVAVTRTKASRKSYSESGSAGLVDAPFSYDDYSVDRDTLSVGAALSGQLIEKLSYRISAAAEEGRTSANDFILRGDFGSANHKTGNANNSGTGYSASANLTYQITPRFSANLGGAVLKADGSQPTQPSAKIIFTGVQVSF
jgi:hypothetical protein